MPPFYFDPAAAKRLLAEASYANGFRLAIDCQNDRSVNDATIYQTVVQMLTRIGIATTPEVTPHAVWVPLANRHAFSLFTYFWTMDTPEPSVMLNSQLATPDPAHGQFNHGVYSNPAFDAALQQVLDTLDVHVREALLIKATAIAMRDVAVLLHHQLNIEAMNRRIQHAPRNDGRILAAEVTEADPSHADPSHRGN